MKLTSGSWSKFDTRRDAAIVGRNVAQRRGLAVGDQFSIGEISVHVAGIFSSTVPAEENLIYTSLQLLQYTRGLDAAGLVTQHEVLLTDYAEPDRVAAEIERLRCGTPMRLGRCVRRRKRVFPIATSVADDLQDEIRKNASGPAKASGDAGSVEQHKLKDQIAVDNHLAGKDAVKNPHRGLRFN